MDESNTLATKMSKHIEPETGLLVIGVAIAFFALFAIVAQYFELSTSISIDSFSVTPYLKFAYACFIKPHSKRKDGTQQTALESFYATQVSREMLELPKSHQPSGFDIRYHEEAAS